MSLTSYNKAIAAAVVAFGGALTTAALDGGVTANEWFGILGAALVAGGGVYAIPNTGTDEPATGKHAAEE